MLLHEGQYPGTALARCTVALQILCVMDTYPISSYCCTVPRDAATCLLVSRAPETELLRVSPHQSSVCFVMSKVSFVQRHLTPITLVVVVCTVGLLLVGSYLAGAVSFECHDFANTAILPAPSNCYVGNTLGWVASAVWTACLLAQLLKDEFFSTCRGLSIVWAWMNFTAASLNCLAVFYWRLPLFVRALAVVMPVLEAVVLHQLFRFRASDRMAPTMTLLPCNDDDEDESADHRRHGDLVFTSRMWAGAAALWFVLFVLGVLSCLEVLPSILLLDAGTWLAILFWSCEGFIQMYVNWTIETCQGQSYSTLTMPGRYLFLAYFSTAAGLLNVVQCVYMLTQNAPRPVQLAAHTLLLAIGVYLGFMTYVVIGAPFPIDATAPDAWLHAAAPRHVALLGPVVVLAAAIGGYWFAHRAGTRPIVFGPTEYE
ncbi:Aste57867_12105 [Aphanomyces stellatus]|uniref:Aste57867_12105 protein n=1 Tax=Aphanomyces stellatus TaxID=120398 RepID=A0A485KVA1_9STRA|nr:hypothetical protein As57867_012060 [Aphanomyces stellatus]VFT88959.1 Aste57867_12105 [Aphanomyces stellatus]